VVTAVLGVYITRARAGEGGLKAINRSFYISASSPPCFCCSPRSVYLPNSFDKLSGPTDTTVVTDAAGANPQ